MTGREHLVMYGRLRGISDQEMGDIVNFLLERLGLIEIQHRQAGTYSGGNKRKLSTAIALIGDPPIVFLDEPTTVCNVCVGCAVVSVRPGHGSWRAPLPVEHAERLCEGGPADCADVAQHGGVRGAVHAVCGGMRSVVRLMQGRLAIMVNGKFKCLGSVQHIKHNFGSGYQMMVKVQPQSSGEAGSTRAVRQYIEATFPDAEFREQHYGEVHYTVPAPIHRESPS